MTVILSRHVTEKLVKELSRLGVTEELLREAVNKPDEILYDSATGRYPAHLTMDDNASSLPAREIWHGIEVHRPLHIDVSDLLPDMVAYAL